jgi:hypothetical protein
MMAQVHPVVPTARGARRIALDRWPADIVKRDPICFSSTRKHYLDTLLDCKHKRISRFNVPL